MPKPTAEVDSGNGVQAIWRLDAPIILPAPVVDANGKNVLSQAALEIIADVEARSAAIMVRLGSVAGTQNIDRILRLPGTTNLPNRKKRERGRTECQASTLYFNGATYPLTAFALPEAEQASAAGQDDPDVDGAEHTSNDDLDVDDIIKNGCGNRFGGDRSKAVWSVINTLLRRGYRALSIEAILLDRNNRISAHIYDQGNPREYAKRQVAKAIKKIDFSRNKNDKKPYSTPNNIRIALLRMGVEVAHDSFADRTLLTGLKDFGPVLDDAAVTRFWMLCDQKFNFMPNKTLVFETLLDTARLNRFHPVLDYLNGLCWDRIERIDQWLTRYAGAKDSKYTRAVGPLMLTAAVRRVRQPACKFDEMCVLEPLIQGTNKSTALATLAVRDEWFSDDLPLNVDGKRVIEALRGRWIVEAAELSGMRRNDIDHLKAFLSRQIDRARMSYDRLGTEHPRQCIIVGTTNSGQYLRDTTGNRRFWPVQIQQFDLAALKSDRDQLWAEAAHREAAGARFSCDAPDRIQIAEKGCVACPPLRDSAQA